MDQHCKDCNCALLDVEVFTRGLDYVLCFRCTEQRAKEQADRRFGQPHYGHYDDDKEAA